MRAPCSRRCSLTTRAVAMLERIATAGSSTAAALEWRHFPRGRTRWKAAQGAGKAESYRPAPQRYRRLNPMLGLNAMPFNYAFAAGPSGLFSTTIERHNGVRGPRGSGAKILS
jgi:hypothetical protein